MIRRASTAQQGTQYRTGPVCTVVDPVEMGTSTSRLRVGVVSACVAVALALLTDVVSSLLGLGDGELLAAARQRAPVIEGGVGLLVSLGRIEIRVAADGRERDLQVGSVAVEHVDEVVDVLSGGRHAEHGHAALQLARHHRRRHGDHVGGRRIRAHADDEHAGILAGRAAARRHAARTRVRAVDRDHVAAGVRRLPRERLIGWDGRVHGDVEVRVARARRHKEADADGRVAGRVRVVGVAAAQGDAAHQRLAVHQRDRAHVARARRRVRHNRVGRVSGAVDGQAPLAQRELRVVVRDLDGVAACHLALPLVVGGRRAQVLRVVRLGRDVKVGRAAHGRHREGHVRLGVVGEELVVLQGARRNGRLHRRARAQCLTSQTARRGDGVVTRTHTVHLQKARGNGTKTNQSIKEREMSRRFTLGTDTWRGVERRCEPVRCSAMVCVRTRI